MFGFGRKKTADEIEKEELKKKEKELKQAAIEQEKEKIRQEKEILKLKKNEEKLQREQEKLKEKEARQKAKEEKKKAKELEKFKNKQENDKKRILEQGNMVKNREKIDLKIEIDEKTVKKQQKKAFEQLEIKLLKMSDRLDDINEINNHIKIKSKNLIELDGEIYSIGEENRAELLKKVKFMILSDNLYQSLKEFDGKRCNLMVSSGEVCDYFLNKKLKQLDSTRWKVFYSEIDDDRLIMKKYKQINKYLYCTKMKKLGFESGKFTYLKNLEKINLLILGSKTEIKNSKDLVVMLDDKIQITTEFIKRHVENSLFITEDGNCKTSISGSKKISTDTLNQSFWQKMLEKITG